MRFRTWAGLGGALVLVLAALPGAAAAPQSWTARYPLAADGEVTVSNVQGSIEVEGWDRGEVEVTVVKTAGEEGSPDDAVISVERSGRSLRLRTLYPQGADAPVQVDYHLRVPRTVSGDVVVREVEGDLEAHTLNGDIVARGGAGSVVAQGVNGDVRVSLRAPPPADGRLQLETINGDVELELPENAGADLELSTVAGRIEGLPYFPAAASEGVVRARLGRGGLTVRLRTIRGDIRIAAPEDML
jgi:hypothetical protein